MNTVLLPGRIDRKIEFPYPDEKTKRKIFQIHTGKMNLADGVDLEELIMSKDELSGADIKVSPLLQFTFATADYILFSRLEDITTADEIFETQIVVHFLYSATFLNQAICTEAGLMALRERRMRVAQEDFTKAKENVMYRKNEGTPEGLYL